MSETANENGALSGGQVRALKIAIVVMGILIVLGLLLVIGRIIYLAGKPRSPSTSVSTSPAAEPRLALPAGAAIRSVSISGDRLAVHYDTPAGAGIAVLDLETGRTLSRVQIVPDAPRK